jgi:hypothetical protein
LYIYSRNYTWALARSFVCRFTSFHSLSEKWEKLQTVWPQGVVRGVGLVGILISGNAYRVRKITKIIVSLWRALTIAWKKFGKVWHKFWSSDRPYRSISQEGSYFPKGDATFRTPNRQLLHRSASKKIMVNNHGYTLWFDFLAHFRSRLLCLSHFLHLPCI